MGTENKSRVSEAIDRVKASDAFTESLVAQLLAAAETTRHMVAVPMSYGLTPEQAGTRPTGDVGQFLFDHMGDVWEVANLFMATRLALLGISTIFEKVTHKHIPDEACFWASIAVGVSIPALMEMGILTNSELVDNSQVVFEQADLFGVGVAASVLIATHYVSKYRGKIKEGASKLREKITSISSDRTRSLLMEEDRPDVPPSQE